MCPFCLATMGLIVAGAASTGGLAALAVKVSRKKNGSAEIVPTLSTRTTTLTSFPKAATRTICLHDVLGPASRSLCGWPIG
jgi:hypothetical protein